MKNILSSFATLLTTAGCVLALGSCNRAEYAMLPQGASYHGVTRVTAPVPAARNESLAAANPEATTSDKKLVSSPETAPAALPAATAEPAKQAVAATPAVVAGDVLPSAGTSVVSANAAPKMTRVQRFAASKSLRLLSKASGISQFRQKLDVAKTQKISGNLRTGIVLLLIALIISLFSRVNSIFGLIGTIVAIIGLIFIVLWLLDNI